MRAELIGGVLVCGGRSLRMGEDKARLRLDGRSLLERAAATLGEVCQPVVLACGSGPRYGDLGLPLVLDAQPDAGPLAGVVAGLEALETRRALVIACDMPRLSRIVFDALLARAEEGDLDACFLAGVGGLEPLCAVYSRRCLPAMKRSLAAGQRRVTAFLELEPEFQALAGGPLRVGRLELAELARAELAQELVTNLNTPEDLERERRARRTEAPE